MAFPASFEESNAALGKPHDMLGDDCEALSVVRGETTNGHPVVISCWKLTAEELAEVNQTGRIWLGIYGRTMPPTFIDGTNPFAKE